MPRLFELLPTTLFRPLASRGAAIYADVLLALFRETQKRIQPLSREHAMFLVNEQLAAPDALTLTSDALEISDDGIAESMDHTAAILRYLVRTGWLRTETQSDFTQTFIIPDYAFRLLNVFSELAHNEPLALRGMICAIHDLLKNAASGDEPHDRLPKAYRETTLLLNGLKELQHNIGSHIDQLLRTIETRSVLEQFFNGYQTDIVDRVYHQLRTSDHLSRYRPSIIDALELIQRTDVLELSARHLHAIGEAPSVEQAAQQLFMYIHTIREQFDGLDRLLEAIDARHSQFVDSAVRTVELHLTASSTTSGQLHRILTHLLTVDSGTPNQPLPADYALLVNMFELELVDEASLAKPSRAATLFEPELSTNVMLSEDAIEQARNETLKHLNRAISRERVRRFAVKILDGHDHRLGSAIPLDGPGELPLIMYLRTYGDGGLGYTIEELETPTWIERDGVGFRDFIVRRVAA